jgi:hypothetical protein
MVPRAASTNTVVESGGSFDMVPYDENLLERSRTQWQFGDWESLANISRDTLQHHPDRAKLALLAAAGHQALGNATEARQYTRLAMDWGCSKKLVSHILVSGVHNTLGRAAALVGLQPRSLKHFESAIAIGTPGSEVRLISQARASEQLTQLGQPNKNISLQLIGNSMAMTFTAAAQVPVISTALQKQHAELSAQIKKQSEDLNKLKQSLEKSIKSEMTNATKQLEAFIGVQNYLATGELTGELHGWPISPDFALYLIDLLETNDYDLVIEFGSGTSTTLIAKSLAKIANRGTGKAGTIQIAFEHLEQYHAQTHAGLQQASLDTHVELVLAPLRPYLAPDETSYAYYACEAALERVSRSLASNHARVLVLVDGPPQATGKHARYPAVPIVMKYFPSASLDILLDDYGRADEMEIARLWQKFISAQGYQIEIAEIPLEKGAILIKTHPRQAN